MWLSRLLKRKQPFNWGSRANIPKTWNAICAHVKKKKNVKAAYLRLMEKDGEQSYLVIVDFTGDRREVFDGIGKAAWNHLNGMFIDLVPLDTDFGQQAAAGVEPFYKR